jgi:hypothetical protein
MVRKYNRVELLCWGHIWFKGCLYRLNVQRVHVPFECSKATCTVWTFKGYMYRLNVQRVHVPFECSKATCTVWTFKGCLYRLNVQRLHVPFERSKAACTVWMFKGYMYRLNVQRLHVPFECSKATCTVWMFKGYMYRLNVQRLHVPLECSKATCTVWTFKGYMCSLNQMKTEVSCSQTSVGLWKANNNLCLVVSTAAFYAGGPEFKRVYQYGFWGGKNPGSLVLCIYGKKNNLLNDVLQIILAPHLIFSRYWHNRDTFRWRRSRVK